MKKITSLILSATALLCFSKTASAQATRLALAEEFTNASCTPCASQNPAFNALLNNNATKIIDIKYQMDFPGFDPMNVQNPTEVSARRTYYGVNGVPNARINGSAVANDCNFYVGAPACFNQTDLDAAYNTATPIALTVSHVMSQDLTSADVTVTVQNVGSTDFTSNGNLYMRLALTEQDIYFSSPPGSTNEDHFEGVMRKMIPDPTGTALPSTMTAGQNWSQTFTVPIPFYIYDYSEISFVAFVQSDGNKVVHNAAFSAPQALPSGLAEAAIVANTTVSNNICDVDFTPSVIITNTQPVTITSAEVQYVLNGGTPVTQTWTGNLAQNGSQTISFPIAQLASGVNTLKYDLVLVNSNADYLTMNNNVDQEKYSKLSNTVISAPVVRGFENDAPLEHPSGLVVIDEFNGALIIDAAIVNGLNTPIGGFGNSARSLMIDFWTLQVSQRVVLYTDKIDLSSATAPTLTFDHAYAQYQSTNDRLAIEVSNDCGATWTSFFNQAGSALATVSPVNNGRFFPDPSEWRNNVIDMSSMAGSAEAIVRFICTSNYGNNLYIDNINITTTAPVSVEENELEGLNLYPVPANDYLQLDFTASSNKRLEIRIMNTLGVVVREISSEATVGGNSLRIDLAGLANGMYNLDIRHGNERSVRKITVVK